MPYDTTQTIPDQRIATSPGPPYGSTGFVRDPNKKPSKALTSSGSSSSADGPGWICRVVQHCEHAEGARSTTTDLTLIRRP